MSNCTLSHTGVLEVLQCVVVESPEALNAIKEGHIQSIISFLDKHGCNHKVVFGQFLCFMKNIGHALSKIDMCYF